MLNKNANMYFKEIVPADGNITKLVCVSVYEPKSYQHYFQQKIRHVKPEEYIPNSKQPKYIYGKRKKKLRRKLIS